MKDNFREEVKNPRSIYYWMYRALHAEQQIRQANRSIPEVNMNGIWEMMRKFQETGVYPAQPPHYIGNRLITPTGG